MKKINLKNTQNRISIYRSSKKLTAKDLYDICCPYINGYSKSLLYDFSQILIASEVLISTFTKNDKNAILQKSMR